jgi:TatD DNase family protein
MLIDSHCHLNMIDLSDFDNQLDNVIKTATENDVTRMLSVCVELNDYPTLCDIANKYTNINISVGIHPNNAVENEPDSLKLIRLANSHPACIAIGETGLDYYRVDSPDAQHLQRHRFREHIRAAIASSKPLIIHTRQAAEDTLQVMHEENASKIGGVMHCFAEDLNIAQRAIDMNFYISMSGIVTFKNATTLHEVAKKIPFDRLLIETDSPYLAPVPYRGKQNHPALVKHVAMALSELRQVSYEAIARQTTDNFNRCFRLN